MTGIIVSGLEKNRTDDRGGVKFTIIQFYISRARRIFPALIVMCLFTLLLGWFFLSPSEYKSLGANAVSALAFFSNIQFWREAGYFDAASHEKLLLHTWSLSVEWQFYIILPIVLLVSWKIRQDKAMLIVMMALGFLISLLLSAIFTPMKQSAAFYLLPTRAWEMLAGGLVYLLANPLQISTRLRKGIEASGFFLIIASIVLLDTKTVWPGWLALLPVIGTSLVLVAACQGSLWTGSRVAQWLGDCSYSLYLWHWPFAVMLVYLGLQEHFGAIAAGLALTLLCGWISYRLIEIPTRNSLTRMPQWQGAGALVVSVLVVALLGLAIYLKQGIPERLPENVRAVFAEAENINPRMRECHVANSIPVPECTYGGKTLGAIVIGDSHAASVIRAVERALPKKDLSILDWTLSSCQTIAGLKDQDNPLFRCGDFIEQAMVSQKNISNKVPIVIVNRTIFSAPNEPELAYLENYSNKYITTPHSSRSAQLLQEFRDGTIETACNFAKYRTVYMVRPIPELKLHVPKTMGRALLMRGEKLRVSISLDEYHERHAYAWETQDIAAKRCGVKILDPLPYLCSEGRCWGDLNGLPIYLDDDHLNERGGSLLIPMFSQIFDEFKQETATSASLTKMGSF